MDRVLASGARGRAFESRRAYQRFSHVHGLPDRRKDRAIQESGRPQYPSDNHRQRLSLVAQRRETSPSEVYLYWTGGGNGNDPWMAIGPNGEE